MNESVSFNEVVEDVRKVAAKLRRNELSRSEYFRNGKFSGYRIYEGGHTWEEICDAAGIVTKKKELVSDEIYFQRLKKAIELLGRIPKTSERKKFGLNFSKVRYPTLQSFLDKAISNGIIKSQNDSPLESTKPLVQQSNSLDANLITYSVQPSHHSEQETAVPPIPKITKRSKWKRIDIDGFPYAPQEENGTVALFAILCSKGNINWQILDLRGGEGIDAVCYDNNTRREIRVELKYILSQSNWNHRIDDLDYVVCWQNRWPNFPKPVIELSSVVSNISSK